MSNVEHICDGSFHRGVGSEHWREFKPGFHDRLARSWPEPREQLHFGGWQMTHWIVSQLGLTSRQRVLDVCCGEGGTAIWIARTFHSPVVGVDIVEPAIESAQDHARSYDVEHLCTFIRGNIFSMPLLDNSFDVVMGQDPDGFAHARREVAFKECFRLLRPGGRFGIHHWIPGVGAPRSLIERFDRVNVEAGYPSHGEVHADAYIQSMKAASFRDVRVVDKSHIYHKHMLAIQSRMSDLGEDPDPWTTTWLELSKIHPFGVALLGSKPE